jgi:molybdenum cofactor biosynthesis enzyme MoaA
MINELKEGSEPNAIKPCANCSFLRPQNYFEGTKINEINIDNYPAICQARCIYCSVADSPRNEYSVAKNSHYPKMIGEIIWYLRDNGLLADDCVIGFGSGEISITPQKDKLLDATVGYKRYYLTNAFRFEPRIADSLKTDKGHIYVSLDSGTRETFKAVKGSDLFDTVLENLQRYRSYGNVILKYIILPGINDSDEDISGIIDVVKSLDLQWLTLSFEFYLPFRASFLSFAKIIKRLEKEEISISIPQYYTPKQISDLAAQYLTPEIELEYMQKTESFREIFYHGDYSGNYRHYKKSLFVRELKDLISLFKPETRFALLGLSVKEKFIVAAFKELGIALQTPDLPYKEAYDATRDSADIFLVRSKEEFSDISNYVEAQGGDRKRLLDIDGYYYSFEPASVFLARTTVPENHKALLSVSV